MTMLINKLVPSTVSMSGILGISSNRSQMLTGNEIAGLLKDLDKLEMMCVYAIDLMDLGAKTRLKSFVWRVMSQRYAREIENPKSHLALFKLCSGVVSMLVDKPNGNVCRCGGKETCDKCHGSEIKPHGIYMIAKYTSVSTVTLYKDHCKRWVDDITKLILTARSEAHTKISINYYGE